MGADDAGVLVDKETERLSRREPVKKIPAFRATARLSSCCTLDAADQARTCACLRGIASKN